MNKMVSVIVPVYNVEQYLRECVNSIKRQTYPELQIILVNDGSTDASGKIAEQCAKDDKRIRVIHRENGGLSAARNTGMEAATGRYISFVDSDDVVSSFFIENLYTLIREAGVPISQCGFRRFAGAPPSDSGKSVVHGKCYSGIQMQEQLYGYKTGVDAVVVWNKLYDRELFSGLQFPEGRLHEDEGSTYLLFDRADRVSVCREPMYYYRQRGGSIVKDMSYKRLQDIKELMWKRIRYYEEKEEPAYKKLRELTWKRYYYELLQCYRYKKDGEIEKELHACARKVLAARHVSIKSKIGVAYQEIKRKGYDHN